MPERHHHSSAAFRRKSIAPAPLCSPAAWSAMYPSQSKYMEGLPHVAEWTLLRQNSSPQHSAPVRWNQAQQQLKRIPQKNPAANSASMREAPMYLESWPCTSTAPVPLQSSQAERCSGQQPCAGYLQAEEGPCRNGQRDLPSQPDRPHLSAVSRCPYLRLAADRSRAALQQLRLPIVLSKSACPALACPATQPHAVPARQHHR